MRVGLSYENEDAKREICGVSCALPSPFGNIGMNIVVLSSRLPMAKILPEEPLEHAVYDAAHRLGVLLKNCDIYKCPISLVDLAQGYYNAPAPKIDTARNPWALFSSRFG